MTSMSKRPPRGALLTVSLGRAESEEWATDEAFRARCRTETERRARERGRRFYEVYDVAGKRIGVGQVGAA